MNIQAIDTERDYHQALREIEGLMGAKLGTPEGERLDLLTYLVEAWERTHVAGVFSSPR